MNMAMDQFSYVPNLLQVNNKKSGDGIVERQKQSRGKLDCNGVYWKEYLQVNLTSL